MFKFTSLFFENLLSASMNSLFSLNSLGTLKSSGSLIPTTTTLSAAGTCESGTNVIDSGEVNNNTLEMGLGITTTSTGASISLNGNEAYNETMQQLEITQAYVESMNQEELEEFITKLELKDIELSLQESENAKTL